MLRKITFLLSASMFLGQHWPHNSKSTVGAQLKFQRWANYSTSTVETLVLVQCWANVITPTMMCCQQLQPLLNVGPTIACYLGLQFKRTSTCRNGVILLTLIDFQVDFHTLQSRFFFARWSFSGLVITNLIFHAPSCSWQYYVT